MDLYHSWLYVNLLNTRWLVWTVVGLAFAANLLSPITIWAALRDKKIWGKDGWVTRLYPQKWKSQRSKR